jgi:hypothetical protein
VLANVEVSLKQGEVRVSGLALPSLRRQADACMAAQRILTAAEPEAPGRIDLLRTATK